ncbi:MAG TPA: HipA family kinase [Solirubrobacteraceae bacterium]|nr:HipA family kinase [Solirubrobacteraceae bacterium]
MSELRRVSATRYVTPLREGGSLPGLVEADDSGLYVTKFRGAGQGTRALVAEVIVGELARALGLPVPDQVVIRIDPALGRAEPDPEIQELIMASDGENLGVDFLPGAAGYSAALGWAPDEEFAADVVWLDALVTNVDRTPRNPNLLLWHDQLWLIDHGAALYQQHRGLRPEEQASQPFAQIAEHVLLPAAGSIVAADERLAPRIDQALLQSIAALVPDDWFAGEHPATYVEYLTRRLEQPRQFVQEAERVRSSA